MLHEELHVSSFLQGYILYYQELLETFAFDILDSRRQHVILLVYFWKCVWVPPNLLVVRVLQSIIVTAASVTGNFPVFRILIKQTRDTELLLIFRHRKQTYFFSQKSGDRFIAIPQVVSSTLYPGYLDS